MGEYVNSLLGRDSVATQMQNGLLGGSPPTASPSSGASTAPVQQAAPPAPVQDAQALLSPDHTMTSDESNASPAALQEASPQENKQARVFLTNVRNAVYGPLAGPITEKLKEKGDVRKTIGDLAAEIVFNEFAAAKAVKNDISQSILLDLGAEVVNELYTFANALGVWKKPDDKMTQRDQSMSLNIATTQFMQMAKGMVDPAGMQQASANIKAGKYDSAPGAALPVHQMPEVKQ